MSPGSCCNASAGSATGSDLESIATCIALLRHLSSWRMSRRRAQSGPRADHWFVDAQTDPRTGTHHPGLVFALAVDEEVDGPFHRVPQTEDIAFLEAQKLTGQNRHPLQAGLQPSDSSSGAFRRRSQRGVVSTGGRRGSQIRPLPAGGNHGEPGNSHAHEPCTTTDIEPHGGCDHRFIRVVLRRLRAGLFFGRPGGNQWRRTRTRLPEIAGDRLQSQIQDAGFDCRQLAGDFSPGSAVCAEQTFEENRDQARTARRASPCQGTAARSNRTATPEKKSGRKRSPGGLFQSLQSGGHPRAERGGQADREGRGKALQNRPHLLFRRRGEKPDSPPLEAR